MKIWLIILIVVILLILLILSYIARFAFNKVLKVTKRRDYFDEKYLRKRYIDGNFEKMKEYNQQNNYIDVNVKSIDNLNLYGRLLLKSRTKFVILIHGYHSISNRLLEFVQFYEKNDFSVLLVDLRGHGKSEGNYVGMGYMDSFDIEKFIDYLQNNYGSNIQIVLHGFSMGAATVMNVIKNNSPLVKFAVEDCGFYDAKKELKYKIRHDYHFPATPVYEFTYLIYLFKTHQDYHKFKPIDSVKKTNIPLLIVHGDKDDFVPVSHAYKINAATNSYHKLLIIKDAGHTLSYKTNQKLYEENIKEFINQFIK